LLGEAFAVRRDRGWVVTDVVGDVAFVPRRLADPAKASREQAVDSAGKAG
jgi:hypothetical protein